MRRETIDLSGIWQFQPDPVAEGEQLGYGRIDYDDRRWRQVRVPGCFDTACPELTDYEGAGWYRCRFQVPADWRERRIVLRFHGVHYHAAVWVNGLLVGHHEDGFLPFDLDITQVVRCDDLNTLAVRSDNIRRAGEVPGLERGWRTFGGLQRRVELVATDRLYIEAIQVEAVPTDTGGCLSLTVSVINGRHKPVNVLLRANLADAQGQVACLEAERVALSPGEHTQLGLQGKVSGIEPWSPRAPKLYDLDIEISDPSEIVDAESLRIGFRRIEVDEGQLLLNGEPLFLTGFNRHEDSPWTAMAEDLETVRRDLDAIRDAGANFVRLCHYPHHPDELAVCDELGLLAMGEIPLYWWRGEADGAAACTEKLAAARRQLAAMIWRDRNHPSLVIWSVSNETEEQRPEVAAGNQELVKLAQELDSTRLVVHVSNHWREHPHFEADDLICVNAYPTLNRRGYDGEIDLDISSSTAFWREELAVLHAQYPDKPILVSEFGYAALAGVREGGLGEAWQARAIEAEFSGMDAPYICGATIWCWADHPWPGNVFGFCYDLAISPYGVVTRDRQRLKAYDTVRHLFRNRQGLSEPPPAVIPRSDSAGDELFMIRPTLDDLPHVSFPEGYGIRPMRLDEAGLWTDIHRDAEPFLAVQDSWFLKEFGANLPAMAWRCFLITDARGVAVGTISAWYKLDYHGEPWGQVHWLAVRPAHQRRGLARAALAYTLRQLARWHERAFLGTQSRRLGAIRLYLDMGFVPDLDHPGAQQAWQKVRKDLDHPALSDL